MIGIYHSKDLDGLCSGAIILQAHPECKMIGWDYGDPIPEIDGSEEVVMADISFPLEKMIELTRLLGAKLTIIDHHKRFIDNYLESTFDIEEGALCNLETTKAACELAFEYFFPEQKVPEWIILLSKWDTWRENGTPEWEDKISPFQYGMRSLITSIHDFFNFDHSQEEVINMGKAILSYVKSHDLHLCNNASFETTFKGYRALCLNTFGISSDTMISHYDEEKHDLMIGFYFTGKQWKVSLRSVKPIDCSLLASGYPGGGGHFHSAGFEVKDITKIIEHES